MRTRWPKKWLSLLAVLFVAGAILSQGSAALADSLPAGSGTVLDDAELEAIRGGFETPSGLQISFGVEQVIAINGVVQTRMALHAPNLTEDTSGVTLDNWTSNIIQNGPGNTFTLNGAVEIPDQIFNVIQNTLDQQVIQHLTVIDLRVTGLNLFRSGHLAQSFANLRMF